MPREREACGVNEHAYLLDCDGLHLREEVPPGHPVNLPHVAGPHGGRQAVAHAVALCDRLFLRVEGANAGDGAEDLLLHDAGALGNAGYDGGRHEVPVGVALGEVQPVDPFATVDDATFGFGERYEASNLGIQTRRGLKCSLLMSAPLLLLGSEGTPVLNFLAAATNLVRNSE
ncbi:hypothetical protein EYF80_007060 [Liparis tanakae]|uniref:Uncharacterized protein n=1 Tax=Liparis tanakae TaxID=230148 RepID=A0A4Z2IZ20_9TELE|nr:hypothetical protein EYF80_007060 [Liparis tanakae]